MRRKVAAIWGCMMLCFSILVVLSIVETPIGIMGKASGATIYVNTTGSGGAYTSIQAACDAANMGDTVFVYDGTYYEHVVINSRINLTGESTENTIIDGGGSGTCLWDNIEWINISYLTATNADYGIRIQHNSTIFNTSAYSNSVRDFKLGGRNCTAINNTGGLLGMERGDGCTIMNNNLTRIYSSQSNFNLVKNNMLTSSTNAGISFTSSGLNTIIGNKIYDCYDGISLRDSTNNNVSENSVSSIDHFGIWSWNGDHNTIYGNDISDTWWGVYLYKGSTNNVVQGNNIYDSDIGIDIISDSVDNHIISNIITNNIKGIDFWDASGHNITNNIILKNNFGIYIRESYNCNIYHNNMLENSVQAFDDSNDNNSWDNGYPNGGNYWSDYQWFDNFSGPNQDIPGLDGIGDIPYAIDSNSSDNYPLMEPIPDTLAPRIKLFSHANNSVFRPGPVLDFYVYDGNLDLVNYSINGEPEQSFTDPYNISTTGWLDGDYIIEINAIDLAGNSNHSWFLIIIDSKNPSIHLNSPVNNSIIKGGTILDLSIIELNPDNANYTVNGGGIVPFSSPFDISTAGWADGDYTVQVNAKDLAGNKNSSWYFFTVDSTKPTITLNTPENDSFLKHGTFLDFSVFDVHLSQVNYNVDGGPSNAFFDPYDLSTQDWADGSYIILINALDLAGNFNISWYIFTIDSTKPEILLIQPGNNSIISGGTLLDFSIMDPNLDHANYSVNGGPHISFSNPFDISTTSWADGDYNVHINAKDLAGNINSSSCLFSIDSIKPEISLNFPINNSIIIEGTTLDFFVSDIHLLEVNFSINGGTHNLLPDPFNISTIGWEDGDHTIQINALDMAGNENSSWYYFKIDSTKPTIQLISPLNNSVIPGGTVLDISVFDLNIHTVDYSLNGGTLAPLSDPYDLFTNTWNDGDYIIEIIAKDLAGNTNSSLYLMTIDTIPPTILLNSPGNNSIIPEGTVLDFSITDPHITQTSYSINGGVDQPFLSPFDIPTTGVTDGDLIITIKAYDAAGNDNIQWFLFVMDSTKPEIQLNFPFNNSIISDETVLDFSIIESNLDHANYSVNGGDDIPFSIEYKIYTTAWPDGVYTIFINTKDLAGNSNFSWYLFTIDSTPPSIVLNEPANNSVIKSDGVLDFSVSDDNFAQAIYSINGGVDIHFASPFELSTSGWGDGDYIITINATDLAGNIESVRFQLQIDSVPPEIMLNHPENNTVIDKDMLLEISILDSNFLQASYSVNGGDHISSSESISISTSGWMDGEYTIFVSTEDKAGNHNSSWYFFIIDSAFPKIIASDIKFIPDSTNNNLDITSILNFSEPMNTANTDDFISLSVSDDFEHEWDIMGTSLIITLQTDLPSNKLDFFITIDSELTNMNGIGMERDQTFQFIYLPDLDNDGVPDINDTDDDNDGIEDINDMFPTDPEEWNDTDLDGIGDNADLDDDNDGYNDNEDAYPLDPTRWQDPLLDTDSDGIPDVDDPDDDNDGIPDESDDFPLDPTKWREEGEGDFNFLILIIIVIIIVSIILVILLMTRKKGKEEPMTKEPLMEKSEVPELAQEDVTEFPPPPPKDDSLYPPPPPPPPPE